MRIDHARGPFCAGSAAFGRCGRLISGLEAERGGTRVSEGVPADCAAVARVSRDRVRKLGCRQSRLAKRSRAPVAACRAAVMRLCQDAVDGRPGGNAELISGLESETATLIAHVRAQLGCAVSAFKPVCFHVCNSTAIRCGFQCGSNATPVQDQCISSALGVRRRIPQWKQRPAGLVR